ncbi:MAG: hypothetical protein A2W00_07540 [Candidatus Eisenbacteria bacterium RBG_16_71_46]|nr:MAG: hypothetical protein A2W00_07540 [Candidatus Eisenbacteria bacterium RBG_16_71_46]OGF23557.1 MAG: hypothetical protein A2V63_08940 [Candidatus Eisenbacteria bacterium RBG_19FT_COMBO_70_11]
MSAISIRPYDPADAPALHEAALESAREVYPWLPWCHPGYTLEEARSWIASQVVERERGSAYEFAVFDETGRFLGGCGLNGINGVHRFANLGYWIRSSAAGRGLTDQAVRALATWAFAGTDLERLEIVTAVGNTRSQRVAEKAGARREGILRARLLVHGHPHDAVMYSIVRADRTPA